MLEFSNACPFRFNANIFKCAYCQYNAPNFGPIKTHTEQQHTARSKPLSTDSSIVKVDVFGLRCRVCEEEMANIQTLFKHLIEAHNKPLHRDCNPGVLGYLLNDGFTCADCGLRFDYFHNLNIHINEHNKNYVCPQCGKSCTTYQQYKNHQTNSHDKIQKVHKCQLCDESFPTITKRSVHLANVHQIMRYKCAYCFETFNSFHKRVAHLRTEHQINITYPCKYCSHVFPDSRTRADHTRLKHIRKRIPCELCDHVCPTRYDLKVHMMTHTKVKNHKCQVCGKMYGRKYTLAQHMRIHNDERRFVCDMCGKAFIQKCSLKEHMKSHYGDVGAGHSTRGVCTIPKLPVIRVKRSNLKIIDKLAVPRGCTDKK